MTTSIKEALEPCPFCGGEAILLKDHKCLGYYVTCKSCFVASATKTKSVAIELWNTRATLQPSGERREAIARLLYKSRGMFDDETVRMHFEWFHTDRTASAEHRQGIVHCYRDADMILASGLVRDEAAIRADEREKCAKVIDVQFQWDDREEIAAAIRSARNGGEA